MSNHNTSPTRTVPQALFAFGAYTKGYYDFHRDKEMSLLLRNLRDITLIALANPATPEQDMQIILARFYEALEHDPAASSPLIQGVLKDCRRLLGIPGDVA